MRPFLDRVLATIISKKLSITLLATLFLVLSYVNSSEWAEIVKIYMLSQGSVDVVKAYKN